tara:strand:+ start:200 stop:490 length:291 start_codon:yes stop_codon:yes gene_type:complete
MYQIDPKVSEKRETNQTVIRGELLTDTLRITSLITINNQIQIALRKVTTMTERLKQFNSKDWIDNLLDEDNTEGEDYVEYDDSSFGDLDLDYTHSQ